jgi:hypothetical protein
MRAAHGLRSDGEYTRGNDEQQSQDKETFHIFSFKHNFTNGKIFWLGFGAEGIPILSAVTRMPLFRSTF